VEAVARAPIPVSLCWQVMRSLIRAFQRLLILGLGVLSVWLIFDVFHFVDRRLPWILAVALTYGIAAYVAVCCAWVSECSSANACRATR
jgi:hypothetical protein